MSYGTIIFFGVIETVKTKTMDKGDGCPLRFTNNSSFYQLTEHQNKPSTSWRFGPNLLKGFFKNLIFNLKLILTFSLNPSQGSLMKSFSVFLPPSLSFFLKNEGACSSWRKLIIFYLEFIFGFLIIRIYINMTFWNKSALILTLLSMKVHKLQVCVIHSPESFSEFLMTTFSLLCNQWHLLSGLVFCNLFTFEK